MFDGWLVISHSVLSTRWLDTQLCVSDLGTILCQVTWYHVRWLGTTLCQTTWYTILCQVTRYNFASGDSIPLCVRWLLTLHQVTLYFVSGDPVPLLPAAEDGRGGGEAALQLRASHCPRQLQPPGQPKQFPINSFMRNIFHSCPNLLSEWLNKSLTCSLTH